MSTGPYWAASADASEDNFCRSRCFWLLILGSPPFPLTATHVGGKGKGRRYLGPSINCKGRGGDILPGIVLELEVPPGQGWSWLQGRPMQWPLKQAPCLGVILSRIFHVVQGITYPKKMLTLTWKISEKRETIWSQDWKDGFKKNIYF